MSCPLLFAQSSEGLFFKPSVGNATPTTSDVAISVSKYDSAVRVVDTEQFPVQGNITKIAALLGFIQLKLNKYAIIANTVEETGKLSGHTLYKVIQHSIVPVSSSQVADSDETSYLSLLETQLTNATLFFSYTYDLTNSFQRNEKIGNNSTNTFNWKQCDTRFFWNHYLSQELRELTVQEPRVDRFIQPIIYGYAKCVETILAQTPISLALVTRRSRFRAGTRYFRRGIDEDGNVANFNETEQVLITWPTGAAEHHAFSLLQTRGSVPVFWAEINNLKYKPNLVLGENSIEATKKHFDQQTSLYGRNYLVSLVNQKGYELPVKEAYENIVRQLDNPDVLYNYFDFHHECRHMKWHRVKLLIEQLQDAGLKNTDCFHKIVDSQGQTLKIVSEQNSVVRTNCMDCLDRTNVVQSVLAHWVLQRELQTANVLKDENDLWESDKKLLSLFQNLWADNADAVSFSYSGTGALKTDFTRTGKRTKAGAFNDFVNSASRYYQNNLTDGPRQDSYDLFLGNFQPNTSSLGRSPFSDNRPSYIQTLPTIIYAALTVFGATIFFPKYHFTSFKNLMFFLTATFILVLSGKFVIRNGMQFVNWPGLVQLKFLTTESKSTNDKKSKDIKYLPSPSYYKPNNQRKSD
ncbi:similar to Saccharomyces cerevisiae YKL212W SAC1 Phosphatidylinositol phosphate (PtdInsP) phosphatase involved in hydrolysis of PtdIns[4]P [Maudiozyma barnettii]|uniref:Similar to Saccharomyces cerevisiae YKL212W SAC1 Phosphatidylinositol phosphate (PtdInsP) phosphatase involved in hydrolysis of PtdIns[4]P n=1 Tax=Maudiozyma barnettii TaxID=61262 RepID=A0A8H2VFV4_9SACH|nr:similar to Saccharomyces cerevisiae YKL212W SAC1 Phosphatidylinositol phosphate (PtdInsP) phosphatase involved in hydrolysis of PtdIns[4]P [Kazachstania barnettii]CAB4254746.1 similar to Saccharomyces cerevisiae YKL212W SAC1 Phosphatidylinositol phosphate (PtdInsP) phosphatase involved in hydrolysis of PtdIns[4]P [Kazachstania barnettii]CAD1782789.1 similar to Saccharomyces cerevisiae YKL212W SAC1 Phosphatidylinositol phosphate (PtdInsP) phosphatase involved in hydrolysis of PtdIns[4]P [Kazach